MKIQNVNDESFKKYGKVLNGYHVAGILKEMEHTPLTKEVVYVPSVEEMEALPDAEEMKNRAFGGLPIQIGYCKRRQQEAECAGISPFFGDQYCGERSCAFAGSGTGYSGGLYI